MSCNHVDTSTIISTSANTEISLLPESIFQGRNLWCFRSTEFVFHTDYIFLLTSPSRAYNLDISKRWLFIQSFYQVSTKFTLLIQLYFLLDSHLYSNMWSLNFEHQANLLLGLWVMPLQANFKLGYLHNQRNTPY
jgi:hypothetical protein